MKKRWLALIVLLLLPARFASAADNYAATPLGESEERAANASMAADVLCGVRLNYGETFSFYNLVGEPSEANGFTEAENGCGEMVMGGGAAQTATTLYMALAQRDDIEYLSIHTYDGSFSGDYAASGYDAIALDYDAGIDFSFISRFQGTLVLSFWTDEMGELCCYLKEENEIPPDYPVSRSAVSIESDGMRALYREIKKLFGVRVGPGDQIDLDALMPSRSAEGAQYVQMALEEALEALDGVSVSRENGKVSYYSERGDTLVIYVYADAFEGCVVCEIYAE